MYDFEIETEVPKRVRNPSRESLWTISKSNSEEDKNQQQQQQKHHQKAHRSSSLTVRQSSQDLEFNDRTHKRSNSESADPEKKTNASVRKLPDRPSVRRDSSTSDQVFEPVTAKIDKRPVCRLKDRLHYSEEINRSAESRSKLFATHSRRIHSDDYENPNRRKYSDSSTASYENTGYTDSNFRTDRSIYGPSPSVMRQSRIASDASVNYLSYYSPQLGKRGSIEYKSGSKKIEVSHRRAMSQYEPRTRMLPSSHDIRNRMSNSIETGRPRTPVPAPDVEEIYRDYRMFAKSAGFTTRQRRNSTRYKVYLT